MDSCISITLSITTVWDIWKHFLSFFFFLSPLVAINYYNNDYLAASQGASAWQLLIRLPSTSRADWLMSLLCCRWPPAAGPTASPAGRRAQGHRDHSFPSCSVQSISAAWPPLLAAISVNPQLPGSSQAMPWYHQNQPPELHLPGRMLLQRGTDTWRPVMKISSIDLDITNLVQKQLFFFPSYLPLCHVILTSVMQNTTYILTTFHITGFGGFMWLEVSQLCYSPLFQHLRVHTSKPLTTSKLNSQQALSVEHYLHDKTISIVW